MARQRKSIIKTVITWLLLLLLLAGGIGAIFYSLGIRIGDITDIFNPVFRIEYNNEVYKADTENTILLPGSGQAVFKVKNGGKYSVKITPYSSYHFMADGKVFSLDKSDDLTEFLIDGNEVYTEYFILNCDGDLLKKAIRKRYGSSNDYFFSDKISDCFLNLLITSETGDKVNILLKTGIILSLNEIIF